jgi:DNA-binding NtrC family response regulator
MAQRILVVDDEDGLCSVLQDLLEMEGFEAVVCRDIDAATEELACRAFDAAILDVYISDQPVGLDLAQRILAEFPDTGVILMTGYADRGDVAAACLSGAYTCVEKPFNLHDVLHALSLSLTHTPSPTHTVDKP